MRNCLYCGKDTRNIKFCSKTCYGLEKRGRPLRHEGQFRKGQKGAFSGKQHTAEARERMSLAKTGAKMLKTSGEQHWSWKGGAKHYSEDDLARAEFRRLYQPQVFARDNYTCQVCYQYGGYLQADHIKPWAKFPELRFELDNCRTLCMAYHYYVTFKKKMPAGTVWGHYFSRRIAS